MMIAQSINSQMDVGNQESTGNTQAQVYVGTPVPSTPTVPDCACVQRLISHLRIS